MASVVPFLTYVGVSLLLGAALFPFYSGHGSEQRQALAADVRPALFAGAMLIVTGGIGGAAFVIASKGAEVALDSNQLWFGTAWGLRLLLGSGLLLLLFGRMTTWRLLASLSVAMVLLANVVWSGHAGNDFSTTARPHLISDAFHVVAAGAWFGALCCFAGLSMRGEHRSTPEELRRYHDSLARFSGIGPVIIATLILSGIFLIGLQKIAGEYTTVYNRVLLAKLAMFAAMLLLAAANRYVLTPRLSAALDSGSALESAIRTLRMSLLAETGLGVAVLAAATWLGRFPAS